MNFDHLLVEQPAPHITRITLFRPAVANAINTMMAEELTFAMRKAEEDGDVRVVIITGEGPKVFCSGADLKERKGMDKDSWEKQHDAFERMLESITECSKPVIAEVNGAAYAGGLEIALACDFMIAASHATFAFTEAHLGIMPGLGGTLRLPRAIGTRRALQILLTAEPIAAKEAFFYGLVNDVAEADALLAKTLGIANQIAKNAPLAVQAIRKVVHETAHQSIEGATETELKEYGELIETKDRIEGINAFNEKRAPVFSGD